MCRIPSLVSHSSVGRGRTHNSELWKSVNLGENRNQLEHAELINEVTGVIAS